MVKVTIAKYLTNITAHTVGIDATGNELRYVQIRKRGRKSMEVQRYGSAPLPFNALHDGEIMNRDIFVNSIKTMFKAHPRHRHMHALPRSVHCSLPERHSFLKLISVPRDTAGSTDEAIRWEATQHIPYDLKELSIDWSLANIRLGSHMQALVVACPISITSSYTEAMENAGYTVLSLEPPSVSITRAYRHMLQNNETEMLFFIGELESFCVVIKNGIPLFTSIVHFTLAGVSKIISEQFKIDAHETTRALQNLGFYKFRARGVIRDALIQNLEALIMKMRDIFDYNKEHIGNDQDVATVIICGPGATIAGFAEELSGRLSIDVKTGSLPPSLIISKSVKDFSTEYLAYSIPLGLSLRNA